MKSNIIKNVLFEYGKLLNRLNFSLSRWSDDAPERAAIQKEIDDVKNKMVKANALKAQLLDLNLTKAAQILIANENRIKNRKKEKEASVAKKIEKQKNHEQMLLLHNKRKHNLPAP